MRKYPLAKRLLALLFALLIPVSFIACDTESDRQEQAESIGGESDDGLTVAVLFSSLADIWLCAGGSIDVTVGETVERGFAPEGTPLVDSGAGKTVNLELLISYEPDLVICSADIPAQVEAATLLEGFGIETRLYRVECFEDYLSTLLDMTSITKSADAYAKHGLDVDARIEALLSSEAAKSISGKKILFVRAGSSASSTKAKTSEDHFAAAMLSELGCVNIADNSGILHDTLSMEAILEEDPDYIFFSLMGDADAATDNINSLLGRADWQMLSAVSEGKVIILPKELFHFKPNAKWIDSYEYLVESFTK